MTSIVLLIFAIGALMTGYIPLMLFVVCILLIRVSDDIRELGKKK